jgi:hypothetical protein
MKKLIIVLLMCSFYSCSNNELDNKQIEINRENFPDCIRLVGQNILLDSIIAPYGFYVLRDSLLLVENKLADPFYMKLYNLNTQIEIAKFSRRGRGPHEVLSADFASNIYNYSNSNEILIYDVIKKRVSEFNLDSLLHNNENYSPNQTDFPHYVFNFSKLNDSCFICFNSFYINDKNINNKVKEVFRYETNIEESLEPTDKYFTANVTGGYVLIAPNNDRIIVPHFFEDKISIYNKNLEIIKTLTGPDMIVPQYRLKGKKHVSFIPKKRYRGYYPCCHTNNSVYIIYVGLNGINSNIEFRSPVEVFKFDWDGNPLKRYILDRYIYNISISSDEKNMYGTYLDSVSEPKLVSYKIN